MKSIILLLSFLSLSAYSQSLDTLNGYQKKISGEELIYYSPLHQFANVSLLTRVNGNMPISWEAPVYIGNKEMVTYEVLIGHSTGTSTGDRNFDVSLNGIKLFTITTLMKKKGPYTLSLFDAKKIGYTFIQQEYDINGDAFGYLYLTVPASMVKAKADFTINGQNQNSRDWLMVFMYQKGLKTALEPTNLITRNEDKRQLNILIDNPYQDNTIMHISTKNFSTDVNLKNGYNKLSVPAFQKDFIGKADVQLIVNKKDTVNKVVEIKPIKNYTFYIIHHSHNDIGYSHLQTEVEKVQNKNITDAINWINNNKTAMDRPIWHIESLWAVENYLRIATKEQEAQFVAAVKSGQLVLSANYANILTGLCQQEELSWNLEYAKKLEIKYGISIQNAMITDIPGITSQGLMSYINDSIPYFSIGPNYVGNQPDGGDRVGGVIREQGDKIFYWKPDTASKQKLMVWTAGKGYSFFHGISDTEKQQKWEQRISEYIEELYNTNYPYDMVQLRYTKNSDNGPVDTLLCSFVANWNEQYTTPQLKISSVNTLFKEFENKYGNTIPTYTGEISPYWEDGAYSTAIEEMENRELVLKTIALGKYAKQKNKYAKNETAFYNLHRNIIMFHEHTWGSWCSISDPEVPFTTEQWKIKKQFLDSAKIYYAQLATALSFKYQSALTTKKSNFIIEDFEVDNLHGGLKSILVGGKNIVGTNVPYGFFEPVYSLGINPTAIKQTVCKGLAKTENSSSIKTVTLMASLPTMEAILIVYTLNKKEGTLTCHFTFDKTIEKGKESLHIAMPFHFNNPTIKYGTDDYMLTYNQDQLKGSNKEFVCVPEKMVVQDQNISATITSPTLALFEVGSIIDENQTNGHKIWKSTNGNTSSVFLYVFNNYWHTNYKAYQDGHFDFEIELQFHKN